MASTAARASARAAPVSPVGMTSRGAARRSASAAIASVRTFSASTTASISRRASRSRSSMRSSSRRRNVSSRLRSSCSRACIFVASSSSAAALARGQPPLVFERLDVPLDLREVLGELRLANAAVLTRAVDDRVGQPEPRRDFERQAAAGRTVVQPVRRRERRRIEAEPGRRDALGRHRVRLQRVVMRGRHHHRPAYAEVVDHRHGERAALVRIGPAPGFVEQHERRQRQRAVHRHDVRDVPRERAEACRDRLFVSDVGEHRAEHRDLRAVGRGNEQARLRHQRKEARRLERDGLASGIRPGHDEDAHGWHDQHVDRDRRLGARVSGLGLPDPPLPNRQRSQDAVVLQGSTSGWRAARSSSRPSLAIAG